MQVCGCSTCFLPVKVLLNCVTARAVDVMIILQLQGKFLFSSMIRSVLKSTHIKIQGWIQSSSSDFQNHSNVSKSAFVISLSFLIAVRDINYPSCFIVYYEIKLRKQRIGSRYPVDYASKPSS